MKNQDFTTTILVDKSPAEVFTAIRNPRAWWSESIEGHPDKLNAEWSYRFEDNHQCTLKTVEMVEGKKIVWLVKDNFFKFTKDPSEWTGNQITFEISRQGDQTQLVFTQVGLVPTYECYSVCRDAWSGFIHRSLKNLIVTGKGKLDWYLQLQD